MTFAGALAMDTGTYVMWGVLLVLALPSVLLMADRGAEPGGAFGAQAAARIGSQRDRLATRKSPRRCRPRSSRSPFSRSAA